MRQKFPESTAKQYKEQAVCVLWSTPVARCCTVQPLRHVSLT